MYKWSGIRAIIVVFILICGFVIYHIYSVVSYYDVESEVQGKINVGSDEYFVNIIQDNKDRYFFVKEGEGTEYWKLERQLVFYEDIAYNIVQDTIIFVCRKIYNKSPYRIKKLHYKIIELSENEYWNFLNTHREFTRVVNQIHN